MSDDIKPAMRAEGDGAVRRHNEDQERDTGGDAAGVFERFNPGAVPQDHDDTTAESSSRTQTPSPGIEADAEQDPQAPNRRGDG